MLSVLERVNLVETESHRLEEYLGSLAANAWSQSSKCDLWTVADVLAHLTWASDYFMTAIAAGRKGDVSPPHGWPETGTSGPEFFNSFIGEKAIEARKNLGDGLFQEFQARNHQLLEIFASVSPDELDIPCYGPFAPRNVQSFITGRVQELAVHGWDIQSSLEPATHLTPATVPVVLERMPQWLAKEYLSSGTHQVAPQPFATVSPPKPAPAVTSCLLRIVAWLSLLASPPKKMPMSLFTAMEKLPG